MIKDLQRNALSLARAGVVRLGYKIRKCPKCEITALAQYEKCPDCNGKLGRSYPTPADHFVLTDAPGVAEAIGDSEPKELRIYFPFDEVDQVFPAYHQHWIASALVCRGDGEAILYAIHPTTGKVIIRDGEALADFARKNSEGHVENYVKGQSMICPGMAHDLYPQCEHCKPNAMLIVLLADVPRLAYYQIATTSIHNIVNLTGQLNFFKQNTGRLRGVPFILKLSPRKISVPRGSGNGRMRTEKYLLSLEVDPEYTKRFMSAQERLAAPERQLLEPGEVIDVKPKVIREADGDYGVVEPPIWMPPNGEDHEEDFAEQDFDRFADGVMKHTPYFTNKQMIREALKEMDLLYDPENEGFLSGELAKYGDRAADEKAEAETAVQEEIPY